VASIGATQAYLDGELCGVRPDGVTSFSMIQLASDSGNAAALVFFLFDLLHLDGEDLCPRPLIERKARLAALLSDARSPLHYCDHQVGHGRAFHEKACAMALEGVVSKRADAPHTPERMVANLRANVPRFYPRVKRFRLFTSWHRCRAREASAPTEVSATAARAVPVGEGQRQNFPMRRQHVRYTAIARR